MTTRTGRARMGANYAGTGRDVQSGVLTGATMTPWTRLRPYVLAVGATAAAIALTRLTWPFFSPTPYAPLFAAIAVTTHWGSGRAGLLAIALAAAGAAMMFP